MCVPSLCSLEARLGARLVVILPASLPGEWEVRGEFVDITLILPIEKRCDGVYVPACLPS